MTDHWTLKDQPPDPEQAQVVQGRSGVAFWPLLTAVLGLACVVLTFLLVRSAPGGGEELGSSAEASAEAACTLLKQVEVEGMEVGVDDDEYFVRFHRMRAASSLAGLAWAQDPAYDDLRDVTVLPHLGVAAAGETGSSELVERLERAQAACTDVTG